MNISNNIQHTMRRIIINKILTLNRGDPLISTLSAKRTLLGFDFSLAFLEAERMADFRLELWKQKV